jgi:hypothetical protein
VDGTIIFEAKDSGTNGHNVVYKSYPGETPVVSGGRPITGWTQDGEKRWKATTDIPSFRQLYVNGVRAVRARGNPPEGLQLHGENGYKAKNAAMADWANPSDIEFCYYVTWTHSRCKVQSIARDGAEAVITMLQPQFSQARTKEGVQVKLPNYIENALELLDEPGEWYLDRKTHTVYYIPRPNEDMKTAEAIAPAVEKLIELKGTLDQPVHNIHFVGLTFAHAGWLRPSEIGHPDVQANFLNDLGKELKRGGVATTIHNEQLKSPSNIVCRAAKSVRFEACTFTKLGSGGIDLEFGSQDNVISGCEFSDLSGTAIQVGDVLKDDHHPDDPRKVVKNNAIVNNYIHDLPVEYKGGVGVFVGYTDGTVIAHNEICNLPYSGVSIGWGWGEEDAGGGAAHYFQPFRYDTPTAARNNRCELNHIHHVMQELNDGGGIYTLSNQPGTVIRGNHIHDAKGGPGGIYLDEGSGFIEVTGNLVYNVPRAMNYNNAAQNRKATCNEHDNFFDAKPGGEVRTKGKVGMGLLCDGSNFAEAPHAPNLEPAQLTVEAWVLLKEWPAGDDTRRWIVNKNTHEFTQGHYALMIDGNKAGAYLNIGGGQENCYEAWSAPNALSLNRWHHLAMTYDGSSLKVYLDGTPVASKTIDKPRVPGSTPLHIGRRQDGYNCFKGIIDEVRIYNRALLADEVKANRAALAPDAPKGTPTENGLVAHWSFDKADEAPDAVKELVAKAGLEPPHRDRLLKKQQP